MPASTTNHLRSKRICSGTVSIGMTRTPSARRSRRTRRFGSSGSAAASFSPSCSAAIVSGSVRCSGAVALTIATTARARGSSAPFDHALSGISCSPATAAARVDASPRDGSRISRASTSNVAPSLRVHASAATAAALVSESGVSLRSADTGVNRVARSSGYFASLGTARSNSAVWPSLMAACHAGAVAPSMTICAAYAPRRTKGCPPLRAVANVSRWARSVSAGWASRMSTSWLAVSSSASTRRADSACSRTCVVLALSSFVSAAIASSRSGRASPLRVSRAA